MGTATSSLLTTTTTNSANITVAPASSYTLKVRAKDPAGNVGPFSAVTTTTAALDQETSSRLTYTGTWTTTSLTAASGGSVRTASAANATATLTLFAGTTKTAIVGTTGPGYGKVQVIVDGNTAAATTLDPYTPTASPRRTLLVLPTLSAGTTHTIKLVVLGTRNTAASGTRVDLDAIITMN